MEATTQTADQTVTTEIAAILAEILKAPRIEYRAPSHSPFAGKIVKASTNKNLRYCGLPRNWELDPNTNVEYSSLSKDARALFHAVPLVITTPWRPGQTRRYAVLGDMSQAWSESR